MWSYTSTHPYIFVACCLSGMASLLSSISTEHIVRLRVHIKLIAQVAGYKPSNETNVFQTEFL
jgi:hypothetical protein